MGMERDHEGPFDILEWHQAYHACSIYFLEQGQFHPNALAVAALMNIALPDQRKQRLASCMERQDETWQKGYRVEHRQPTGSRAEPGPAEAGGKPWVSLVPYIRRLVVTGFDREHILVELFGPQWKKGVEPLQKVERRNYLFAVKSVGWADVKRLYDHCGDESVPFLRPLDTIEDSELDGAERAWSRWLAMEDWMLGPRIPPGLEM